MIPRAQSFRPGIPSNTAFRAGCRVRTIGACSTKSRGSTSLRSQRISTASQLPSGPNRSSSTRTSLRSRTGSRSSWTVACTKDRPGGSSRCRSTSASPPRSAPPLGGGAPREPVGARRGPAGARRTHPHRVRQGRRPRLLLPEQRHQAGARWLTGPWISGGVEFNWPQHHRPATFLPTDVSIEREADGSVTVWCSDHDPFARMKGMHGSASDPTPRRSRRASGSTTGASAPRRSVVGNVAAAVNERLPELLPDRRPPCRRPREARGRDVPRCRRYVLRRRLPGEGGREPPGR